MKKLAQFLATVVVVCLIGLSGIQPAQAVVESPGILPSSFFPLGSETVYGASVFVYGERTTGSQHELVGYQVDFDGTVNPPHVFEDVTGKNYHVSSQPFIQLKNGSLAFTWATISTSTRASNISIQISRDGEVWGATMHLAPEMVGAENNCSEHCGYISPVIAQDSKGVIAVAWSRVPYSNFSRPASVEITTSAKATTWTKPVTYSVSEAGDWPSVGVDYLLALPQGGFTATWSSNGGFAAPVHFTSAFVTGKGKKFSTPRTLTSTDPTTRSVSKLVRATSTKYLRFQVSSINNFTEFKMCYQTLDTAHRAWSKNTACFPAQPGITDEVGQFVSTDATGNSVLLFSSSIWDNDSNTFSPTMFHVIKVTNGVAATSEIQVGSPGMGAVPISLARDVNNNVVVAYVQGTTIKQATIVDDVLQTPVDLFQTTLDNDVFYSSDTLFNVPAIVDYNFATGASVHFLMADSAPILDKLQVVSGSAKVGSKLKTSIPFFNSPNGYSASTFQWYSCGAQVTVHFNNIPSGICNPIAGATQLTYKLRKQDKGYYIAVAATNHNLIGSTTVLSKSTSKIK